VLDAEQRTVEVSSVHSRKAMYRIGDTIPVNVLGGEIQVRQIFEDNPFA